MVAPGTSDLALILYKKGGERLKKRENPGKRKIMARRKEDPVRCGGGGYGNRTIRRQTRILIRSLGRSRSERTEISQRENKTKETTSQFCV